MPPHDTTPPDLPVGAALPALRTVLAERRVAVLQAPPGAGTTTRVPLTLLDEPWLRGAKIIMLEPRRLAARAAATFMARLLGERVGETVGYRVRLETRVGPRTRIEVVTEGILGRMLQDDPALEGTGLVIFDEFHERSVHADLGLALTLQTRTLVRPDLGILVMSATLDGAPVAALLGDAPIVTSEGRAHPVETRYVARRPEQRIESQVAATVRETLHREPGDMLVFLPGAAEIRRVASLLEGSMLPSDVRVVPLHGTMPMEQQDLAIARSPARRRKVVLATAIAETSLTIEGVRVVIDSGLMRVPRFSPGSGMTRLETRRVSRASADQRRGRAGRTEPGVAYRLWSEHEEGHLVPHGMPEILETDLAPVALTLAEAGIADPATLDWLDAPPAPAYAQARQLLVQLGALDASGVITVHGRRMAALPMHPRLSHMVLSAPAELRAVACDIAALLGERDVLRGEGGPPDADLRLRLEALRASGTTSLESIQGMSVDRDAVRRAREQSREWRRQLGGQEATASAISRGDGREANQTTRDDKPYGRPADRSRNERAPNGHGSDRSRDAIEHAGSLLARAYPDRIAQRRTADSAGDVVTSSAHGPTSGVANAGRFLLRNGRGAALGFPQALSVAPYLVVAELGDQRPEARIFLAAPISLEEIHEQLAGDLVSEDVIAFDEAQRGVMARRRTRLGALVLADAPLRDADPERVAAALLDVIRAEGVGALPWSDSARRLRERIGFAHRQEPGWPDVSDEALAVTLHKWLAPHLAGMRRLDDLRRLDLSEALGGLLDWRQRTALDELAPTHITVPSGSRIPIDYADPDAPVLAVRLQEMFGCTETPRVARGKVALTLQLLSPAQRPVQVTRDLAGFWRTSYFEVRKDLRGRYPKHHWPDDPLAAEPTSRAKRRGQA